MYHSLIAKYSTILFINSDDYVYGTYGEQEPRGLQPIQMEYPADEPTSRHGKWVYLIFIYIYITIILAFCCLHTGANSRMLGLD